MKLDTKTIKIIFSQKKFDNYFSKRKINQDNLTINEIKTILCDISSDFIIGKISLDLWSSMAGKLYWFMIKQKIEKKESELFFTLETISDLGFYIRQTKNNQTSEKIEEIFSYLESI